MLTISYNYHGLISPVIIDRYKQERKITKIYERVLKQNGRKAVIPELRKISLTLIEEDADAYQKQKALNVVYREALNYFKCADGGRV